MVKITYTFDDSIKSEKLDADIVANRMSLYHALDRIYEQINSVIMTKSNISELYTFAERLMDFIGDSNIDEIIERNNSDE